MSKNHNEQVAELFGYLAELRQMEESKYINPARIGYIMKRVPELDKALNHYPEVKTQLFILAKNLLLQSKR